MIIFNVQYAPFSSTFDYLDSRSPCQFPHLRLVNGRLEFAPRILTWLKKESRLSGLIGAHYNPSKSGPIDDRHIIRIWGMRCLYAIARAMQLLASSWAFFVSTSVLTDSRNFSLLSARNMVLTEQ